MTIVRVFEVIPHINVSQLMYRGSGFKGQFIKLMKNHAAKMLDH